MKTVTKQQTPSVVPAPSPTPFPRVHLAPLTVSQQQYAHYPKVLGRHFGSPQRLVHGSRNSDLIS